MKKHSFLTIISFAPATLSIANGNNFVVPIKANAVMPNNEDLQNTEQNQEIIEFAASEKNEEKPIDFFDEESIARIIKALKGRTAFKPYTVLKHEMSKIDPSLYSNFLISCALTCDDTCNIALIDCITNSGENYKQAWFKDLLDCLKESRSPFLNFKANALLKYHFG